MARRNPTEDVIHRMQKAQAAAEIDRKPIFECPVCGGRAGWSHEKMMGQRTGRRHVWCQDCGVDLFVK